MLCNLIVTPYDQWRSLCESLANFVAKVTRDRAFYFNSFGIFQTQYCWVA